MKINILEHPKSKSFFEEEIVNATERFSARPYFMWTFGAAFYGALSIAFIGVALFSYFDPDRGTSLASSIIGLIFLIFCIAYLFVQKMEMRDSFAKYIEHISEAPPERCIQIERWLKNEEIRTFINKVVTLESRKLRNCEIYPMEDFFYKSLAKKAVSERQGKIDSACEKIYISPLVNPA